MFEANLEIKATQELIDKVVSVAYGESGGSFELTDITDDLNAGEIADCYPISLEKLASDAYYGFNDDDLANWEGLGHDDVITDMQRADYAFSRLESRFEEPDYDCQGSVHFIELQDSEGRKALVTFEIIGDPRGELEFKRIGVFQSEDDIKEYYHEKGYILGIEEVKEKMELIIYWNHKNVK